MRNTLFLTTMLFLSASARAAGPTLQSHHITWEGSMPAVTHHGTVAVSHAELRWETPGVPKAFHVDIDMAGIANLDLKKPKDRAKLEGHLKSKDFFAVDEYPTARFELTEIDGDTWRGQLTVRGKTLPVVVPVALARGEGDRWELRSDFTFNRQDFGVSYQNKGLLGTAKDKLIRDEIRIGVHLVFQP